ncbi:MAG: hypothetical protein JZU50_06455 [Desulfobulbaceae bacterium]|jgi:hypothetical protein|nr:hypothetical protein [Desulfobulbaceae bacterium]
MTNIVTLSHAPSGRLLYNAMCKVLSLPECRWAIPQSALRLGARCSDGLEAIIKRRMPLDSEAFDLIIGSAWYSPVRVEQKLGWRAEITLDDGLREMFGR